MPERPPPPPPQEIGRRYAFLTELGAGSTGRVFRAHDLVLDRAVAIKLLHARSVSDIDRRRFEREGKALASLSHPRVVRLLDAAFAGDVPYLVMELLEGRSLAAELATGWHDEADLRRWLIGTLEGLECLHAARLVHRDVKPSNIFLRRGEDPTLIDLGIVRSTSTLSGSLTEAGLVLGSPRYLAPEVLRGTEHSPASDLFQVGLVGFEALTGIDIHSGRPRTDEAAGVGMEEVLSSLASGTYVTVAERNLRSRGAIGRVILRALAAAPEDRYACASAMIEALRQVPDCAQTRLASQERPPARGPDASEPPERSGELGAHATQDARQAPRTKAARATMARSHPLQPVAASMLLLAALALVWTAIHGRMGDGSPPEDTERESGPAHGGAAEAGHAWQEVPSNGASAFEEGGQGGSPDARMATGAHSSPRDAAKERLALLDRWSARVDARMLSREMYALVHSPGGREEAQRRWTAIQEDCGLTGGHFEPGALLRASPDAASRRRYWPLFWLQAIEREALGRPPADGATWLLFPDDLRPGAAPSTATRAMATPLGSLPGLTNDASEVYFLGGVGRGLAREIAFKIAIDRLDRARAAWIVIRVRKIHPSTFITLRINGVLDLGLVGGGAIEAGQSASHSVPLWCLREGVNEFRAGVDSSVRPKLSLDGLESCTVLLAP